MFIHSIIAIIMALLIIVIRLKSAKKPANAKKILLPPFFMSTGFLMFLFPPFQVEISYVVASFLLGNLLSLFLIKTSTFVRDGSDIFLERSKVFIFIIFSLLLLRIALRSYVNQYITLYETSSLFFVLAFGMLLPWRIAMYTSFKKFKNATN